MLRTSQLPLQRQVYEIVPFDQEHLPACVDLAKLHLDLLPTSPISLLGPLFAQAFYYRLLPQQGLIWGAVAYVDQRPVGFIVATHDPANFMGRALRRHWPYLIWIVALSVLQNPIQRLAAVWEALQIMGHLPTMTLPDRQAEVLSLGVREAYRRTQFGSQSGRHIAADLFNVVKQNIQAMDLASVRAVVDLDNAQARSFYGRMGWQLRRSDIPGWRVPSVELVWQRH
jgi:ribosomal protein S18 acetylase RimI-like enzyme